MRLSGRERKLLLVFFIFLICVSYYFYFYKPLIVDIETMAVKIEDDDETLSNLLIQESKLPGLSREMEGIQSEVENILDMLPRGDDEPGLVVHLYEALHSLGLKSTLVIHDPVVHREYVSVTVQISMNIDYANLKEFIDLLEKSRYRNSITNLVLNRRSGPGEDGSTELNASMTIAFYFHPDFGNSDFEYEFMDDEFGRQDPFSIYTQGD